MPLLQITCRLIVLVRFDDQLKIYVSYCPALDLYSQGDTFVESIHAIRSAIDLWIKHCYARTHTGSHGHYCDTVANEHDRIDAKLNEAWGLAAAVQDDEVEVAGSDPAVAAVVRFLRWCANS